MTGAEGWANSRQQAKLPSENIKLRRERYPKCDALKDKCFAKHS
jgi:hypothetical protein